MCHSHCVCLCRVRELQPTPIYTTHKHSAHTGFIKCQHFLEVPPPPHPPPCVCQAKVFLSPCLGHTCVIFKIALADFYCHYCSQTATSLKETRTLINSSVLHCVIWSNRMTTSPTSNTATNIHTRAHTQSLTQLTSCVHQ